jgi:LuxR family maltose regulon positive regulatory protein
VGLGSLLYERNDLEAAQHHLLEGIRFAEQGTELGVLINGYTTLARVKQTQGDPEGALALAEQAEQLGQGYNSLYWAAQAATCRARLWLRQGQLEAVKRWARERQLGAEVLPDYLHEVEHLTLTRLLLATHDWGGATELLRRLREAAEAGGRIGRVAEALALQALAYQAQGEIDQAFIPLRQALLLAEPQDYVRLFLDEGTAMEQLLFSLKSQLSEGSHQEAGIRQVYLEKLLAAFKAELKGQPTPTKSLVPSLVEPLSERELEILGLMAGGMSNQDIAQKVVVTIGTVKWHLNNIYGKLDVRSRTQAIARARELGLL